MNWVLIERISWIVAILTFISAIFIFIFKYFYRKYKNLKNDIKIELKEYKYQAPKFPKYKGYITIKNKFFIKLLIKYLNFRKIKYSFFDKRSIIAIHDDYKSNHILFIKIKDIPKGSIKLL